MCTFVLTMHDNGKPEHNDEICKKQLLHNNDKPKHDDEVHER